MIRENVDIFERGGVVVYLSKNPTLLTEGEGIVEEEMREERLICRRQLRRRKNGMGRTLGMV